MMVQAAPFANHSQELNSPPGDLQTLLMYRVCNKHHAGTTNEKPSKLWKEWRKVKKTACAIWHEKSDFLPWQSNKLCEEAEGNIKTGLTSKTCHNQRGGTNLDIV